ncbi:hypothetical protein Btus_0359 [Kyrpidia tusciae DSM 2912]|uniref:Uncharacterized protein n=1 Tax=Kyrpidia tusciae (strain DSM 2912 / NBRC 15312 / T2) TaxID=562970 RepID=D5WT26_KYRT2|nr:hypothetical protein Btus_0359 [Kyrpidia tusciae DSM 2912]
MEYRRLTAAEYFEQIKGEEDFFIAKGNFLDDFYSADNGERARMVSQPIPKERVTPDNRKYAAYFAAMVEYLCWHYNIQRPDWVLDEIYRLPDPWFLYENWRFRAWQLVMTPPAFVSRNIFTGDDPVSRM